MRYSSLNSPRGYTAEDLSAMMIAQIKDLAAGLGYSVTETKKADVIAAFLREQEAFHA